MSDTNQAANTILNIRKTYKEMSYRDQKLEQTICEAAYKVVAKKLANNEKSENVIEFIKNLDLESDLKLFLRTKIGSILKGENS